MNIKESGQDTKVKTRKQWQQMLGQLWAGMAMLDDVTVRKELNSVHRKIDIQWKDLG